MRIDDLDTTSTERTASTGATVFASNGRRHDAVLALIRG